jgi:hypothetical protein
MNISSIGSSWSVYFNYLKTPNTGTSQASSDGANLQKILYSADGDSLQLSGDARNVMSNYMMYGPPQGPPPGGEPGAGPGPSPEIKDFLDKVASGTATNDDLKNMQSVLQKMRQQFNSSGVNNEDSNTTTASDPIKAFLDKVMNGTATDDDLQNMQSVLQTMQKQRSSETAKDDAGSIDSELKSFLDKVASGTATDDDLKNMQSELQKMQQQFGGRGVHRHHHHHGSESDGTNPNSTSLDTTNVNNSNSDLKSFLDKVAGGTATNDDLKNMQSILQQMQQQYYNGFANSGITGSSTGSSLE